MIRAIDATELKTAFPLGEYVRTECVQATIDNMRTIEAIPVKWLQKKRKNSMDAQWHYAAALVLAAWKKEQEAQK